MENLNITMQQIGNIKADITSGKPLWAMLQANEYKEDLSFLRKGLEKSARERLSETQNYQSIQDLLPEVLSGKRLGEFNSEDQKRLAEIQETIAAELTPREVPVFRGNFRNRKLKLQAVVRSRAARDKSRDYRIAV